MEFNGIFMVFIPCFALAQKIGEIDLTRKRENNLFNLIPITNQKQIEIVSVRFQRLTGT